MTRCGRRLANAAGYANRPHSQGVAGAATAGQNMEEHWGGGWEVSSTLWTALAAWLHICNDSFHMTILSGGCCWLPGWGRELARGCHAAGVLLVFTLNHIQIAHRWRRSRAASAVGISAGLLRLDNSFKLQITTACRLLRFPFSFHTPSTTPPWDGKRHEATPC